MQDNHQQDAYQYTYNRNSSTATTPATATYSFETGTTAMDVEMEEAEQQQQQRHNPPPRPRNVTPPPHSGYAPRSYTPPPYEASHSQQQQDPHPPRPRNRTPPPHSRYAYSHSPPRYAHSPPRYAHSPPRSHTPPPPYQGSPPQLQQQQQDETVDMGYEVCEPTTMMRQRRGSMSHDEEKQRRASIKAIMADTNISPMAKRRSIQHLMDGRRNSMNGGMEGRRNSVNGASAHSTHGRRNSMNGAAGGEFCASVHSTGYAYSSSGSTCGGYDSDDFGGDEPVDMGYGDGGAGSGEDEMIHDAVILHQHPSTCTTATSHHVTGSFSLCNEQTRRAESSRPPCTHYERKCTIIAACCGAAFGCRICHDDCPTLPPKINNGGRRYHRSASLPSSFTSMNLTSSSHHVSGDEDDTTHQIDRFAIRELICRECFTRQSSKTNNCVNCKVQFGSYHCNICNLWMSAEDNPYHCSDCGFCRVGGSENFSHCHDCGMCIDRTLFDNHNCRAGKYRSNCPVCQEYLFSSRAASHEMPCGHAIHWDCFRQLAAHDSRCPVCKKTAETKERMMPTWNAMAAGVALQPVPPELARVVNITCNDCEKSEIHRAWHFLGVQCNNCSSFNTVVDKIVLTGEEAHRLLEGQQQPDESAQTTRPARRRMNRRRSAF